MGGPAPSGIYGKPPCPNGESYASTGSGATYCSPGCDSGTCPASPTSAQAVCSDSANQNGRICSLICQTASDCPSGAICDDSICAFPASTQLIVFCRLKMSLTRSWTNSTTSSKVRKNLSVQQTSFQLVCMTLTTFTGTFVVCLRIFSVFVVLMALVDYPLIQDSAYFSSQLWDVFFAWSLAPTHTSKQRHSFCNDP